MQQSKNSKKSSNPTGGSGSSGSGGQQVAQFAPGVVVDNSPPPVNPGAGAGGKNNLSVTLGQSKGGSQDAAMTAEDGKKKDGAGAKQDLKLKDPN